jgi:hypothetical protein
MISESKKKDLELKYSGNTNDSLLTYLRRNYPVETKHLEGLRRPVQTIYIDDKYRMLVSKKYITQLIYNDIEYDNKFSNLEVDVIRRTIKKYLDYMMVE